MNQQPYILQRFDLLGRRPLIAREKNYMRLEVCGASAYFACKNDSNIDELIARFKEALGKQYGNVMDVEIGWAQEMMPNGNLPVELNEERKNCSQIPFRIQFMPALFDSRLYSDIIDCPYMEMVMFVPQNHIKYFDSHSVYLNYKALSDVSDWKFILQKVAEFNQMCIPVSDWLK